MVDEYRKSKRRRDFSSSDDDDDPFRNQSTGFGFSAMGGRNRLNATPSSTIRADSVAGKSRASTIKGGTAPQNANASGGKAASVTQGEQEFTEFVGDVPEYHTRLKELWSKRTHLMKTKKKKGKKRSRRSALKKSVSGTNNYETETNWDDDKTSFMTTAELK